VPLNRSDQSERPIHRVHLQLHGVRVASFFLPFEMRLFQPEKAVPERRRLSAVTSQYKWIVILTSSARARSNAARVRSYCSILNVQEAIATLTLAPQSACC
jgi:hypothetical protein